jgi:hypothetical protein
VVTWLPETVCCVAFLRLRWHDDSSAQHTVDSASVGSTVTITASGVFMSGKKESPRSSSRCAQRGCAFSMPGRPCPEDNTFFQWHEGLGDGHARSF